MQIKYRIHLSWNSLSSDHSCFPLQSPHLSASVQGQQQFPLCTNREVYVVQVSAGVRRTSLTAVLWLAQGKVRRLFAFIHTSSVGVYMPQAKRRVTFSRPPVGVGVSQACGVEAWTASASRDTAETRLRSWTSQEIQGSTNLMGVPMTMPEWHAF